MRTAINLYTVRELSEPLPAVVDRVANAGYDGVQLSGGFGDASPEAVADRIAARGLDVTGAHVGIEAMESDLPGVVEDYAKTLGCDSLVVPRIGEAHFESRAAVEETAARLDGLADSLAAHDLALHYHNHAHEFVEVGDRTAFEHLVAESDVGLELDVGWAHTGGLDPVELLDALEGRVSLVHMKDMAEGELREIGEGDVDMLGCARAAREIGADWLIYEHDEPVDPAESIDHGARFLDDLLARL